MNSCGKRACWRWCSSSAGWRGAAAVNDLADRVDSECEHELAEALRVRKPAGPEATGFCLYCREPLVDGRRWCPGTECAQEWQRQEQQRAWACL